MPATRTLTEVPTAELLAHVDRDADQVDRDCRGVRWQLDAGCVLSPAESLRRAINAASLVESARELVERVKGASP